MGRHVIKIKHLGFFSPFALPFAVKIKHGSRMPGCAA